LDLEEASPHAVFTAVIYGDNRSKFGTPETALRGKRTCVTGQVSDYRGKPEIVITDPSQLSQ
jgi:DNA/RNA endonuclease YhcR with UshA esterase domain